MKLSLFNMVTEKREALRGILPLELRQNRGKKYAF